MCLPCGKLCNKLFDKEKKNIQEITNALLDS